VKAVGEAIGGVFLAAINGVLYILLGFFALLFSVAATMFAWAVDATVWQQLFNMKSVYNLWGMIRDFFNLFFILTLLFIAFCTIFQIQAYNYKKWLLNLVLMALLTNFSFPVARFLIDATNVPMYFFLDSAVGDGKGGVEVFEAFNGGSKMNTLLFPPLEKVTKLFGDLETTKRLVRSLIFVFLLAASLLVLAVLFLVRLVALVLLVIFSPVGFAGSAIPWTQSFSKKWWDYFFKYALFGPAAALMILVSIKFLQEFSGIGDAAGKTISDAIGNKSFQTAANVDEASTVTAMVTMLIPLILIWTSISVGQMMGVMGGDKAMGWAKKASMWTLKNTPRFTGRGLAFGARNMVTKKNKETGEITARNWTKRVGVGGANLGSAVEGAARRSYAKASLREEQRKKQKFREKRREILGQMSEVDRLKELHASQTGIGGMLNKIPGGIYGSNADVAQSIIKDGIHKKLDADEDNKAGIMGADGKPVKNGVLLQTLHKSLEDAGDKDTLKTLESERPDVMLEAIDRKYEKGDEDRDRKIATKRKEKIEKFIADNEHKKLSNVAVMNEQFVKQMTDALGEEEAFEKIAEMPSNVLKRAEKVAEESIGRAKNANDWAETGTWRKLGAMVSGDARRFFSEYDKGTKTLGTTIGSSFEDAARDYVGKLKPSKIEKMSKDAAGEFAKVASVGYFKNASEAKLSAEVRQEIFDKGMDRTDAASVNIREELSDNPKWKSYRKGGTTASSGRSSSFTPEDWIA